MGTKLNTSKAVNITQIFSECGISHLSELDFLGVNTSTNSYMNNVFDGSKALIWIEKIVTSQAMTYNNWFKNCTALEHVIFDGEIGNDISFADSKKLDKASIESIVNTLSGSVTGKTVTLSKTAIKNEFGIEISVDADIPTDNEFYDLRWSKANWSFSYSA